jgi:hypothetical protein
MIRIFKFLIGALIIVGCKAIPDSGGSALDEHEYGDDYSGVEVTDNGLCAGFETQLAECEEEVYNALLEVETYKDLAEACAKKRKK